MEGKIMELFVLLSCIVVLVIIIAKIQSRKYFLCKHCSKEFQVKPDYRNIVN